MFRLVCDKFVHDTVPYFLIIGELHRRCDTMIKDAAHRL